MEAFSILSGLEDAFTTLVSQMSPVLRHEIGLCESLCSDHPCQQGSITDMGAQAIRIQQIWDLVSDDNKDLADSPAISMERDAGEIQKESLCA